MTQKNFMLAANWKMNGTPASWQGLLQHILPVAASAGNCCAGRLKTVVFPPFLAVPMAVEAVNAATQKQSEQHIFCGVQTVSAYGEGAFTGEISASMAAAVGVAYALVGHSERRHRHHEDATLLAQQITMCHQAHITPVLCVGENEADYRAGKTEQILKTQLTDVLTQVPKQAHQPLVVAYEPVWAIGTGLSPNPPELQEICAFLHRQLAKLLPEAATHIPVLYGGSVSPQNIAEILTVNAINGVLVGGASLKSEQFVSMIHTIADTCCSAKK